MAQRVHVTLEDDLDGSKADETIKFGLDGVDYEIDLSKKHAKALRGALAEYIEVARKASRTTRKRHNTTRGREEARLIREWAEENGYEVSARGRVPAHIREAYAAAN